MAKGGGIVRSRTSIIIKKSDEIVNNSVTLQDDDELFLAVAKNTTYFVILTLFLDSTAVANFKYNMSIPAGATSLRTNANIESGLATATNNWVGDDVILTNGNDQVFVVFGTIKVGATGGKIQLRWAQNTAEVSNSELLQGSSMLVFKA